MDLVEQLRAITEPARVKARLIDRVAYASDASFYHLVPQAVVQPKDVDEIREIFALSQRLKIPMTFRAAGTSLSGQAVTDGILVDVSKHWRKVAIEDQARKVRVQPGVIGGYVNLLLKPHERRIGPDPASIMSCMMGGILANNSSGMCCGVQHNAYRTMEWMRFVLPDGSVFETTDHERFAQHPIAPGLEAIRQRLKPHADRIRKRYAQKNTTGYSINAFVDFEHPLDIMSHVLIGSEGTLGFIAEAVLRTIPDPPLRHTALLLFPTLRAACDAIAPLNALGVAAAEIMDRASLRCVEDQAGVPPQVKALPPEAAAILVEWQCANADELAATRERATEHLPRLADETLIAQTAEEQAALWNVRKGLLPSVGAARASGTTVITEDVTFAPENLAEGVALLHQSFQEHGYPDGVVFGHARDANVHFLVTQSFNTQEDVERYDRFMAEVVRIVVDLGGTLKAEHGTGRNMAPFVLTEWGQEAYDCMRDLKRLVDPHGLLNPGVIINDDPRAHVTHLKKLPSVEPEVDRCIECGFCESRCPSRDLTLTPRQRIVVRREMERRPNYALWRDYQYDGLDTCAADGMCATGCPVAIDTGQLVKRLRSESHHPLARRLATVAASNYAIVETAARAALTLGHAVARAIGHDRLNRLTRGAWRSRLPLPGRAPVPFDPARADAVYFPSCVSRIMGVDPEHPHDRPQSSVLRILAERAGVTLRVPDARGLCCGMPYSSKGFPEAHQVAVQRVVAALGRASEGGRIPIVVDNSSCAYSLIRDAGDHGLRILDVSVFLRDFVLPGLETVTKREETVVLHPVCSAVKLGTIPALEAVARACATDVRVPIRAGCCGFAGDRGLQVPELTASATRAEAVDVSDAQAAGHYASNRSCELGMTLATGATYRSIVYLVDRALASSKD